MNSKQFVGKITKVIYRKNHYSILLARVDGLSETLIGYFPVINEGMVIKFYGKKELGRNKREQFKVQSYSVEMPKTNYQLYNFLMNDFIQLEEKIAGHISDNIGVDYLNHYQDDKYLQDKLGEDIFNEHRKELTFVKFQLNDIKNKLNVMDTMVTMGFSNELSARVAFSEFKATPETLKSNPYTLLFPFDLTWTSIDSIAINNGILRSSDLRIQEAILYILDEAVNKLSHIYLPRDEVLARLNRLLRMNLSLDEFKRHEKAMENDKRIFCDVELNIYGYRYYQAELQLSKDLFRLNDGQKENEKLVQRTVESFLHGDLTFSPEQEHAIWSSLINPLTIISGSAGTGKTTVVKTIIEALSALKNKGKKITDKDYYHIALCAPTGKAAERMREVTGREARTLHSMLNHHPLFKTPSFNENNPLEADCLVIDESGMNDTILFSHILNAAKKNCKVIIVGDVDQLPSIGPGNVLKELLAYEDFNSIQLTRVYRQGEDSCILDLAIKVKEGDAEVLDILNKKTADFSFIENHNLDQLSNIIVKTMDILYSKSSYDFYRDIQIISPIHKSKIGTVELNYKIQQLLNSKEKRKKMSFGDKDFFVGDKVIHTVNNSEKKVYNGETGVIKSIIDKVITVEFMNGKVIAYTGDELFELDLAFCVSVHKMQGSEAQILIFPIHNVFANMLQRKLLYTGITRAKQKLLLMGQAAAFIKAINTDTTDKRNCNLAQRFIESRLSHLFTLE